MDLIIYNVFYKNSNYFKTKIQMNYENFFKKSFYFFTNHNIRLNFINLICICLYNLIIIK